MHRLLILSLPEFLSLMLVLCFSRNAEADLRYSKAFHFGKPEYQKMMSKYPLLKPCSFTLDVVQAQEP